MDTFVKIIDSDDRSKLKHLVDEALHAYKSLFARDVHPLLYGQLKTWGPLLGISIEQVDITRIAIEAFIKNELLQRVSSLDEFDERMVPFANRTTSRNTFSGLSMSLITRALEVGSEQVIVEFENYLSHDYYTARQILPIAGIILADPITLEGGVILEPTTGREEQYQDRLPDYESRILGSTTDYYTNYYARFVKEYQHPRFFADRQVQYDKQNKIIGVPDLWDFTPLEEACLCLTVIGPSGPILVATSLWASQWVPNLGGPLGQLPIRVEAQPPVTLTKDNLSEFVELHRQYVCLPKAERAILQIPLTRLNSSIRRQSKVDAAIDLGIALESLLADSKPFHSSILFTLRLRAARLLRVSKNERVEISKLISNLYALRSKGAHDGNIPSLHDGIDSESILKEGAKLVAELIKYLILNGKPDWNDVFYG